MKLKQSNIDSIKLPAGKTDHIYWDDDLPGFGLRIREKGSRGFVTQYKHGTKQRRMTLGSTKELTLIQARDAAKAVLAKVHLGGDPAGEKEAARAVSGDTFGAVAERYLAFQANKAKPARASTLTYARIYLIKHCKPLHCLPVAQITRRDIASRLSAIASSSGNVSADRARSNLSACFAWALGQGLVESNPVIGTTKHAGDIKARDRVLDDSEMAAVWNALPRQGDFAAIIKLLLLTGARRDEIAWLKWSEIDFERKLISLPAERCKNGNAFTIPLSDMAADILGGVVRRDDRDLVFGTREGGYQNWDKSRRHVEAKLPDMKAWTIHDLRRSVATGMANLGVLPHTIEACLNHVAASTQIARTYNKATYEPEKRQALAQWANHIKVILAQADGANVHKLRRA